MINIKKLRKSYGTNEVLKGIDLEIDNGEVGYYWTFWGGKSTLLRCINLLEQPDDGDYF